jgi:hypothetical protein
MMKFMSCCTRFQGYDRDSGKKTARLTAPLVREDGLEEDTFRLIVPKCYDVPGKSLNQRLHSGSDMLRVKTPYARDVERPI